MFDVWLWPWSMILSLQIRPHVLYVAQIGKYFERHIWNWSMILTLQMATDNMWNYFKYFLDETIQWIFRYSWTICKRMLIPRKLLNDFVSSDKHGTDEGEGGFACFLSLVHWQTRGMDSHCVLSRKEISVKNEYRYSLWLIHQTVGPPDCDSLSFQGRK